jgi:hypothetical protein
MPQPITDPDLIERLNKAAEGKTPERGPVSDPAVIERLEAEAAKSPTQRYDEKYGEGANMQDQRRTFLQGISSWSDEGLGGLRAIGDVIGGENWGDAYTKRVNAEREGLERYKESDPSSASNISLGGMATSMLGPGAIYKGLTKAGMGAYGALSATGALSGMHYGSGAGDPDPEASWNDAVGTRLRSAAIPTVAGATLAPALGVAGEKVLGPLVNYAGAFKNWLIHPENSAYKQMLAMIGPENLDKLATYIATGTGRAREDIAARTLKLLGEEMSKAGGDAAVAQQAAIQRIMQETGVAQSTAEKQLRNVRQANQDSPLFFAEYPAVAEANAATRLAGTGNRAVATPKQIGQIENSAAHEVIDDLANSGGSESVSIVKNAVNKRYMNAGDDTADKLRSIAPGGKSIEDTAQMIADAEQRMGAEYKRVHDEANGLWDIPGLHTGMQGAINKHLDHWAMRGGEQKDELLKAIEGFYLNVGGNKLVMPSSQMAQDMRGALRGKIKAATQSGEDHIVQVLQPLYDDVTAAMRAASPEWWKVNRQWANKEIAEKADELGAAFATKAGPKYRQQLEEFNALAPEMQDIVRLQYLQKLDDELANARASHDVAKFFDTRHEYKAMGDLFGPQVASDWARFVRDLKVGTMSKGMLHNSKTASRLARQERGGNDEAILSAVENASVQGMRQKLMEKMRHLLTERKNRALAKIATTPISDTASVAGHIQKMREVPERLQKYEQRPLLYRDRAGQSTASISSRATTEPPALRGGIGPRYDEFGNPRASGGPVREQDMKTFGNRYDSGGMVPPVEEEEEDPGFFERLMRPVGKNFYGKEAPFTERAKTMGAGAISGATFGIDALQPEWAKKRIEEDQYGDALVGSMLAGVPATGAASKAIGSTIQGIAKASPAVKGMVGTGVGVGATGATASSAGQGSDNPLQSLFEQKANLARQRDEAVTRREAKRPKNRVPTPTSDPQYTLADNEVKKIETQLEALNKRIDYMQKENSPERALELKEMERQASEKAATAELDKPFAQRHPTTAAALTTASYVLPPIMAFAGMKGLSMKGDRLIRAFEEAREAGNMVLASEALAKLRQWQRTLWPKQAATIGTSASVPFDAQLVQDATDRYKLPKSSQAQQDAEKKLSDFPQYLADNAGNLVTGLTLSGVGAHAGKFQAPAPRGDAKALTDLYSKPGDKWFQGSRIQTPDELSATLGDASKASTRLQKPLGEFEAAKTARGTGPALAGQKADQVESLGTSRKALPSPSSAPAAPAKNTTTLGDRPTAPQSRSQSPDQAATLGSPAPKTKTAPTSSVPSKEGKPYRVIKTVKGQKNRHHRGTGRFYPKSD